MKRHPTLRVVCPMLALLTGLAGSCLGAQSTNKTTDQWKVLRGASPCSVIWSPSGDCIAFTTEDQADERGIDLRASIWIMSLTKQGQIAKIERLTRLTRKEGIPTALFWLDNSRIGWAASYYPKRDNTFGFMQMGLHDRKPQRLADRSFEGVQGTGEIGGFGAPDDVYYDAGSRTLLFSAALTPNNDVYVRILPLVTGKVRSIRVPHAKGLVYPKGYVSNVTLCGSVSNATKLQLFFAAYMQVDAYEGGGWYLWRSSSYSLRQDKVLVALPHQALAFPRTSPNRKLLAYLRSPGGRKPDELILHDLSSDRKRILVREIAAGVGCPFSWSPDGKMIAYAEGPKIKIVPVVLDPAGNVRRSNESGKGQGRGAGGP